ncbi:TonB-dependent receptor [Petrimonas sp.]|uniref:TonB-dependent receptor n=1 Tax=Petrimonas sp. TaxID=2023866 RepID=UPI003F518AED
MNFKKIFFLVLGFSFVLYVQSQDIPREETDSTILLNEIVVNAYQVNTRLRHVPGSISVLSGEEVQVGDGNNFASALHTMPGIYMHSGTYATSRIVIRGVGSRTPYNTNRIKAYLNDIPITSSDGISSPEDIDLLGIGRMEVTKGPASALYGSGLGGNINLFTSNPYRNSANALLQYGSYNTLKASAGGTYHHNDLNLFGNVNHTLSDGYRENNNFRRTSLLSSGNWRKPTYSLEYTLLLLDLNAQIPSSISKTLYETNPTAAAANWKEIEGFKEYRRGLAGVTLENRLSGAWSNRLTVFGRWVDSYERRPFNNLTDGSSGGGIRNKLNYHAEKFDAVLGLEWIADKYRWELDLNDEMINKNAETRNNLNVFAMTYYRPSMKWNISLGGAVNKIGYKLTDKFPDNGDQSGSRSFPVIFSPRLGANYAPNNFAAFYASVGHGFSMPSPEETLLPEGDINKDLQPEQGWQYEAGIRLNLLRNATQIEVSVYQINLNNLLVTKRLTEDIFTGINAGKTQHRGVELLWRQRIFQHLSFPGNLNLNANYTYSQNKFIDFTDDDKKYDGNLLPGIPSHLFQASLLWNPVKPLVLDVRFQYTGEQFINDANTETNASYFLSDVKASYSFSTKSGKFELFAGINNLTDTHYSPMLTVNAVAFGNAEPRYYYPGLPRHFYGGVVWRF